MVLRLLGEEEISRRGEREEGARTTNGDAASVYVYRLCTGLSSILSSPNMFDPPIQQLS